MYNDSKGIVMIWTISKQLYLDSNFTKNLTRERTKIQDLKILKMVKTSQPSWRKTSFRLTQLTIYW